MTDCYGTLDNSSTELHSILKEYSLNSELAEDEDFRLYLLGYLRENRQLKTKMAEAESNYTIY